jgi:hypothetical protein
MSEKKEISNEELGNSENKEISEEELENSEDDIQINIGEIRNNRFYLMRDEFEYLCKAFDKSQHKSSNMMTGIIYELELPLYKILVSELTLGVTCEVDYQGKKCTITAEEIREHVKDTLKFLIHRELIQAAINEPLS